MSDYYKIKLLRKEQVAKRINKYVFSRNQQFDFVPGQYALFYNNKNVKTISSQDVKE